MGHSHHKTFNPVMGGPVDDGLQPGNQDLAAFKPEALLAGPLSSEEVFEPERGIDISLLSHKNQHTGIGGWLKRTTIIESCLHS